MSAPSSASKNGRRGNQNRYAAAIMLVITGMLPARAVAGWNMWLSDDSYEECLIKAIQKHGIKTMRWHAKLSTTVDSTQRAAPHMDRAEFSGHELRAIAC